MLSYPATSGIEGIGSRLTGPLAVLNFLLMFTADGGYTARGGSHGLTHSLVRCFVHHGGKIFYNFTQIDAADANDELPGLSAFIRNEKGEVFHTYSSYARGPEELVGALMVLDRAPLGRNEGTTMDFVRRHDEYDIVPKPTCCQS